LRAVVFYGPGERIWDGAHTDDWISIAKGDNENYAVAAAALYRGTFVCCELLKTIEIPVIVVLHGRVGGAGLALALSADLRVSASNTSLVLEDRRLNDLFELTKTLSFISGNFKFNALSNFSYDASAALKCHLLCTVRDIVSDAKDHAISIVKSIQSAPIQGLRNTIKLMRNAVSIITLKQKCFHHLQQTFSSSCDHLELLSSTEPIDANGSSCTINLTAKTSVMDFFFRWFIYQQTALSKKLLYCNIVILMWRT
jgi:enoyl-CoA hydratase/carnithine racemase